MRIPQHSRPDGQWCPFSGCDSASGICRMCEPDPACWADPLTRAERAQLRKKLSRAALSAATAAGDPRDLRRRKIKGSALPELAASLNQVWGEMADLHLDVTERAAVATS